MDALKQTAKLALLFLALYGLAALICGTKAHSATVDSMMAYGAAGGFLGGLLGMVQKPSLEADVVAVAVPVVAAWATQRAENRSIQNTALQMTDTALGAGFSLVELRWRFK